ncbi:MAG: MarR family winged helix-turn-helix transcriptional regulator [Microbacterium sp.]
MGALLGQAQARFHEECERQLAVAGFADISLSHSINVLRHLRARAPRRISEVARISSVTKQAISQQVAYLADRDYIVVTPDESDGRRKCIMLTPRGEACLQTMGRIFGDVESEWRARHGAERIAELTAVLEAIVAHPG